MDAAGDSEAGRGRAVGTVGGLCRKKNVAVADMIVTELCFTVRIDMGESAYRLMLVSY